MKINKNLKWIWILLFVLIAPCTPSLDLFAAHLVYDPKHHFYDNSFFRFLFLYGERCGFVVGGIALIFLVLSLCHSKWKKWRKGSIAVLLTLIIGAGLITNVFLKGFWGRPRPKQLIEFGGKHEYRPFWKPNFHTRHDPQKSFPSGHVAMGFYFLAVYFVGKRYKNSFLIITGAGLTFFVGGGLMVCRVAQGGHFVSDVLASAILMYYCSKIIDYVTWGERERDAPCEESSDTSLKPGPS